MAAPDGLAADWSDGDRRPYWPGFGPDPLAEPDQFDGVTDVPTAPGPAVRNLAPPQHQSRDPRMAPRRMPQAPAGPGPRPVPPRYAPPRPVPPGHAPPDTLPPRRPGQPRPVHGRPAPPRDLPPRHLPPRDLAPRDLPGRASQRRARSRRRLLTGAVPLLAIGVLIYLAIRLGATWSPIRYLIYATWTLPLVELAFLAVGQVHFRLRFKDAPPGAFSTLIIQITTTGKEQDRVNEIIAQIRGHGLEMDHEIWVCTEPGQGDEYPDADRVLVVPASFRARSERKARALEYSRRVRAHLGLDRADVKIIFNDDDVSLTREYIVRAFAADYDICEGVVTPRTEYSARPLSHFISSHADDVRTHACLVYCSVFQGIIGRPLHVHGEGLTVTGEVEREVTWNWPAFASEDLVFGQRAARAGFIWGWFHEYVEVTSPWSVRDFITQRRRWIWGDIHGILHRDVLSPGGAALTAAKYLFGIITLVFSISGFYLRVTGKIPGTSAIFDISKIAIAAWVIVFFACGWIGSGSRVAGRNNDSRLLAAVVAVATAPISIAMTFIGIVVPLMQGNPGTFKVIRKTRG